MEKSSKSSSYWEDEYAQEQQHNSVREEQQQQSEEQQVHANAEEQQQYVGAEEQHQYVGAEGHMEEPEPWKFSNMYYQPRRTSKLTVSRGKSSVVEEEVNSGSDLFYPSRAGDSPSTSRVTFALDRNYQSHIEYRWGVEGLRKYLVSVQVHCFIGSPLCKLSNYHSHIVLQLPPLKELQKLMRIQSLRCHALYNHSATRLSVIPIHASRSQALRFSSISLLHAFTTS